MHVLHFFISFVTNISIMKHVFTLDLEWKNNGNEALKNKTFKNHSIQIKNKEVLNVSAAKAFKGDALLYNPEDLLLSSLASCHMMSYLYCCQKHNIEVLAYNDSPEAFLEVLADGSGKIVKAVLKPEITLLNSGDSALALSLHKEAAKLCFIANSCNFEIEHQPKIKDTLK